MSARLPRSEVYPDRRTLSDFREPCLLEVNRKEERKKVKLLQKGTKLIQKKIETTNVKMRRRNKIAIRVLYSQADKRILLLFRS
jgi:hypothetical protein